MSSVILESSTKHRLDGLKANLPHAILLSGPVGVGLSGAVSYLLDGMTGDKITILPERNDTVDVEKGTINIKIIRRLYDLARTKGSKKYIIIDYAETMAKPAQNAFLKLLEEPNDQIHFILLSHQPQSLLPTIMSRVQKIDVRPISIDQSNKLLDSLKVQDENRRRQLMFIAGGLVAEINRLQDDDYFEARSSIVKDARTFITGRPYDRSILANAYRDDRQKALTLIDDALKLLKITLESKKDPSLFSSIDSLMEARDRLAGNGNIRLQLAVAL